MIQNTKTVPVPSRHHFIRTFFASLFGLIALVLIFVSIIIVWLDQTVTNTNVFVQTLAPLASQSDVQNFVAGKAAQALISSAPVNDLAATFIPTESVGSLSSSQLDARLLPVVQQNFLNVMQAPQFSTLWRQTLKTDHQQFMTQLNSAAPYLTLDLRPAIEGVISQLQTTDLRVVSDKVSLQGSAGVIIIKGDALNRVRHMYRILQTGMLAIVAFALLMSGLCVLLSVHHARTLRRIMIGAGITALAIGLALQAAVYVPTSSDPLQQKATVAIIRTLFHNLQFASVLVGVFCIVVALGSKLISRFSRPHPR